MLGTGGILLGLFTRTVDSSQHSRTLPSAKQLVPTFCKENRFFGMFKTALFFARFRQSSQKRKYLFGRLLPFMVISHPMRG
jgi:hypothetical protein